MSETRDILRNEEKAMLRLRGLYHAYGYRPYRMSKFEEYDFYAKNKNFLLSDNVITFTDTNGKLMALKPDVTLSIVKNSKEPVAGEVRKLYYNESVYRPARGGGPFREIMQIGLECIGDVDEYAVAEVLSLAAESLALISLAYVLDVSHLGLLAFAVDATGAEGETRAELLRCVSEKNAHGIGALGLAESKIAPLYALLAVKDVAGAKKQLPALFSDPAWKKQTEEFFRILDAVSGKCVQIDFSAVSDLGYYNGVAFRGFLRGVPQSVLSGGQYDRLMQKMGKRARAVGFAVYPDTLEFLENAAEDKTDVYLLYDGKTDIAALARAVSAQAAAGKTVLAVRRLPADMGGSAVIDLCGKGENDE